MATAWPILAICPVVASAETSLSLNTFLRNSPRLLFFTQPDTLLQNDASFMVNLELQQRSNTELGERSSAKPQTTNLGMFEDPEIKAQYGYA